MADSPDSESTAVTRWYSLLEAGDDQATAELFGHCFPKLLRYARGRLPGKFRRVLDEEDVALSAFESLCRGARRGAYGDIHSRDELWRLLACITARKATRQIRYETREKRGGGRVRGNSIFAAKEPKDASDNNGLEQVAGTQSSPEAIAEMSDECQRLLDALEDPNLQTIALLRLEGYSVAEIAERIGCAKRSAERRLSLIRKIWIELDPGDTTEDRGDVRS